MLTAMTMFGAPDLFAVEYEPIPCPGSGLAECHFTYWIGGRQIGNYEFDAPICEVTTDMESVLRDRAHRRDDRLFDLPKSELVRVLETALLERDEALAQIAIDERWVAHRISYFMRHGYRPEFGQDWEVYFVESSAVGRLAFHKQGNPTAIFEQLVPAGSVDDVLYAAWDVMKDVKG